MTTLSRARQQRVTVLTEIKTKIENMDYCYRSVQDWDKVDYLMGQAHFKMHVDELLQKLINTTMVDK